MKKTLILDPVLYIPVKLIWRIKIQWTQKAVLAFSLCLTVVMILVTITRISGIKIKGHVDHVWETYFLVLAAEIGIILAAVTAFRVFFVSRHKKDNNRAKNPPGNISRWNTHTKYLLKRAITPSLWRTKSRGPPTFDGYEADKDGHFSLGPMPDIPRAHMTGVRTFIDGRERGMNASRIMESQMIPEDEDTWPLREGSQQPESQV